MQTTVRPGEFWLDFIRALFPADSVYWSSSNASMSSALAMARSVASVGFVPPASMSCQCFTSIDADSEAACCVNLRSFRSDRTRIARRACA